MDAMIKVFHSEQFGDIRTAGDSNEPLFCLADLCNVLGIVNNRNVKNRLDPDDVHLMDTVDSIGKKQEINFVTESGMYDVIIRSDSDKAKPFRKWVTSEVLPSIRKNGIYATDVTIEGMIQNPDFAIELLNTLKEERRKRIEAQAQHEEDRPKVLFATAVETSQKSILVGELSKILRQNGIDMGQNRLFAWLRLSGYLCSTGERYNQPTQHAMDMSLFEIKKTTITKPSGSILVTTTVKVTGKGQIYFVNKFLTDESKSN